MLRLHESHAFGYLSYFNYSYLFTCLFSYITELFQVIHPNVRDNIDADLDILRALAYALNNLPFSYSRTLKWLNLEGMTEEFASMLKIQLDLRTEAKHLNQFNENFANDPEIIFPEVNNIIVSWLRDFIYSVETIRK